MTIEARSVSKKKSTMGKTPTNQVALTSGVEPAQDPLLPSRQTMMHIEINLGC